MVETHPRIRVIFLHKKSCKWDNSSEHLKWQKKEKNRRVQSGVQNYIKVLVLKWNNIMNIRTLSLHEKI